MWLSTLVSLSLGVASAGGEPPGYLALGDSYTIGESVAPSERWPAVLAAMLHERGIALGEPHYVARTGWTTDELDAAIDAEALQPPYALVSLLVGVNNQYRGRDADEYRTQFAALLERAVGFAGGDTQRVLALSIPDWGATPFAEGRMRNHIARELDEFNAIAREECARRGVAFVDITPISRDPVHGRLLADDGLHPSGAQYALWAQAALPVAERLLKKER